MWRDRVARRPYNLLVAAALSIGAFAGGLGGVLPAHASLVSDGVCDVTMTISAPATINKTAAFVPIDYSGSGTCVGANPVNQTVSFVGTGSADASCTLFETVSSSFSFGFSADGIADTTTSTGVGTMSAIVFYIPGVNSIQYDAVASFAWNNVSEQRACLTSSTSTITMTGVIVFQDPQV